MMMAMTMKRQQESQSEQSKRFIEKARELGVDETEAGQEKAFGKVGMKKPTSKKRQKSR